MINYGTWALANRKLIYFLVAIMLAGGVIAYENMSKLEDPELAVKQAMIVTLYPGASPHQVELEVTDILEKSIRTMNNIDYVESRSMSDVSMIKVELLRTVGNDEVQQEWDMLRRKVADVQGSLPDGAAPSIVMDNFGDVFGMFYAMTFDGLPYEEASKYAELVQREIGNIEGISQVSLYGERHRNITVELQEDRMATLGIMPAQVISTLSGQNRTVYSGYYESGERRIRVTVDDKYRNTEDIGNLLLQGYEDDQLRLRDIAVIKEEYSTPVRNAMRYDRQDAIGIAISGKSGTDITKLGALVDEELERLTGEIIPAGVGFEKVFFQPERVHDALHNFVTNLIESIFIVIFILMLAMGFRSGLIIGMNLLITVLGSVMILSLFDGTLQRISLAAFILAMGMLVDNAIVILDGVLIDIKTGRPRRQALTSIGQRTAMPLLGATLIAILAFLPIFLSPDSTGIYIRDLFIVLAISLLLSWVLALVLIPIQANSMLPVREKVKKRKKQKEQTDPHDTKAYKALKSTLGWCLNHRIITVASAVGLLGLSLILFGTIQKGFFPDMNYDQLYIEYTLPDGNNSTRVSRELASIEEYLLAREDVTHVTASIGGTPARYNLVRGISDPSLSYGELIVDFDSPKALVAAVDGIQEYINANYPDAYARVRRYNLMYKQYPIEVEFHGPDPAVLRSLTDQAKTVMEKSPDVWLITDDWGDKVPVLRVKYDQPIARELGLSRQDIGISLLSTTDGIPVSTFYDGAVKQNIYVKCVDKDGNPIESLENTPVFGMIPSLSVLNRGTLRELMTGAASESDVLETAIGTTPLNQVTKGIDLVWEYPTVVRKDGQRVMRAQANPAPGVEAGEARQSILSDIENITLPDGYRMSWGGEYSASTDATKYLFDTYPLAVVLMISILIMLFKDYRKPIIIILCLPFVMIGVIFGFVVSGFTFNFVAIVAILGLMGMLIKNGIVLMDEITLRISQKQEPVQALLESTANRFRPVMMASLTTILGMVPLLPDELFGPGAVTIMGGLLVGTLITLLILPVLYAIFFNVKTQK